jgi:cellulose synthase (UDP-forming)
VKAESTPAPREAFNADSTLVYIDPPARRAYRHVVAVAAIAIYAVYLIYRGLYTINPEARVFSLTVYLAEIHGFFSLIFFYFQIWTLRGRRVRPLQSSLTVDAFITTYNEDVTLLRQTVRAAIQMRHPHRTFVLDDGRRPEVRALCEELGCEYLTRPDNAHAKAGNWNHAFMQTNADLIATFDADHVPRADFLERTLGFFDDPKVALVQVPQRYHNLDSLQHRVSWRMRRLYGEQDVFFNLVMPGKDHWNASFFCGTGAVLRREALVPSKGLLTGTITEDMHTSLVLQAGGWKSVYLNELLVTGLAPMDFSSYSSQRLRWAEGNLKIIRHINPLTSNGLTFTQRICYFASMYHWTIGFPKIVFYLAPPLILFTGLFPIIRFDRDFLLFYAAHLLSLVVSYKVLSRGTGRLLMDELFNMANCFTLLIAAKRFVFGRGEGKFVVTSKRGGGGHDDRVVMPHFVLMTVSLLALVWSALGLGFGVTEDVVGAGVAAFWTVYNLTLMAIVVGFALRPLQKRHAVRFRTAVPVEVVDEHSKALAGVTLDVSEGGCTLLWPKGMGVGSRVGLRLHFGPKVVACQGEVRSVKQGPSHSWVGHGIEFVNTGHVTADQLADAIYNTTVPEMFTRLSQRSWAVRQWTYLTAWISRSTGVRQARREAALPVRVSDDAGSFLATTRDLSVNGLGIISPKALQVGAEVHVELVAAAGDWRRTATVTRVVPVAAVRPEYATWHVGLRLHPSDAGALDSLLLEEAA